jgi:hypothetical protein
MAVNPGNREATKEALALALARGLNVKLAAKEAGVCEKTAYTYRKEEGFDELVKRLQGELFAQAVGILAGQSALAAATLAHLMLSPQERVKLAASRSVLEEARAWRGSEVLAEQVAELRRQVEAINRGGAHGGDQPAQGGAGPAHPGGGPGPGPAAGGPGGGAGGDGAGRLAADAPTIPFPPDDAAV